MILWISSKQTSKPARHAKLQTMLVTVTLTGLMSGRPS